MAVATACARPATLGALTTDFIDARGAAAAGRAGPASVAMTTMRANHWTRCERLMMLAWRAMLSSPGASPVPRPQVPSASRDASRRKALRAKGGCPWFRGHRSDPSVGEWFKQTKRRATAAKVRGGGGGCAAGGFGDPPMRSLRFVSVGGYSGSPGTSATQPGRGPDNRGSGSDGQGGSPSMTGQN